MAHIIDKRGNKIGKGNYKNILPYSEGFAPFEHSDGKWGMLDLEGNIAIPPMYEECKGFSEGLAAVKVNDKWGYINKQNEVVIPFVYDWARNFYEGFTSVKVGELWCIINAEGTAITKVKYKFVVWFSEGIASVCDKNRWTCVDATGKELFKPIYKIISPFVNGYAYVKNENDKFGVIDKLGEIVIECKYDDARYFMQGLIAVCKDGLWGFLNISGEVVIPFQFDNVLRGFVNGVCCVKNVDHYGFIDKTGIVVAPFVFTEVITSNSFFEQLFTHGLAVVSLDNSKGHTNNNDKIVAGYAPKQIRTKQQASNAFNTYGIIRIIDCTVVLPFKYKKIRPFSDGLAQVVIGIKTGYVNTDGEWVIPLGNYGFASSFGEGRARVNLDFYER